MKVSITRIDRSLPLPEYHTPGSVAFDLYAREETVVEPHQIVRIPANLIVDTPPGHVLILAARSSTPKKGLSIPHGMGLIDQDFCGPEDELLVQLQNWTDRPVTVERGERIAQAMIAPIVRAELVEREKVAATSSRSGFGSTG